MTSRILDRVLAFDDDGNVALRDSDTEQGRMRIAERLLADEPDTRAAVDALEKRIDAQHEGMLLAVDELLHEHEQTVERALLKLRDDFAAPAPPAPEPEPAADDAVTALGVRLAKLEADVATLTASVTSLTEAVDGLLPPIPLSAKPAARKRKK